MGADIELGVGSNQELSLISSHLDSDVNAIDGNPWEVRSDLLVGESLGKVKKRMKKSFAHCLHGNDESSSKLTHKHAIRKLTSKAENGNECEGGSGWKTRAL